MTTGHPTPSLSAADLMTVLLSGHLHCDWDQPHQATNDHLIVVIDGEVGSSATQIVDAARGLVTS